VIVSVQGGGQRVNIGGQTAVDEHGNVVGKGDMRAQIEQTGKNIQSCLKAAGATASEIVLVRAYVTDGEAFKKNVDALAGHLGPQSVSSISPVPAVSAGPDFLVEIEAVAKLQ
jgi:enamine deaminase RidA (YjgF/YER057c/UK114 family)